MEVEFDKGNKIVDFYLEGSWLEGMSIEKAKEFANAILKVCEVENGNALPVNN